MIVGVPKETKVHEYRVGLAPASVRELVHRGHKVLVETGAGASIGLTDDQYRTAGAVMALDAEAVFAEAELLVKVKEPQATERKRLRDGQVLFTYLHLAPDPEQAADLIRSGCVAIAYETVTDERGGLPLLAPMSEIAGRMSILAGAQCLALAGGGRGVLLPGAPGVAAGQVVILGGGVVGTNAARMAVGLGAAVIVVDKSLPRLVELDRHFDGRIQTAFATMDAVESHVVAADLVVGAVLVAGAAAPKLVSRATVGAMKRGAAIVDVSIDQGGVFETSRPTTHAEPTYIVDGVVHYCVANMPGAFARTSTLALNNATLPFVLALADLGYEKAFAEDPHLREGLNICRGHVTHRAVAHALHLPWRAPEQVLGLR